jgi:plastocyanin
MHRSFPIVLAGLLALPLAASLHAATLDVQVTSASGAPVQDAVVYAVPAKRIPAGHKVAVLDQKDRMFVPHVLPIQAGTWVEFPNSDNIRHQVYSLSPVKRFQLPLYSGKPAYPLQFPDPGTVTVGCNIHDWMNASIVVVDTPHFAKTEAGKATLAEVPAGQYTLHVWYEGMKDEPKPQAITVAAADHPALAFVTK